MGDFIPLFLFPYILLSITKVSFNKSFLLIVGLLISFSLLYSLAIYYYNFASPLSILGKLIYPIMFLLLGYNIVSLKYDMKYKIIRHFLLIFIISLSSYGIISLINTLQIYGNIEGVFSALGGRVAVDFWNGNLISATSLNSFLSLGLALLPILFLSVKKNEVSLFMKLLVMIVFTLSLYASLQVSSRTGVLIIGVSIIFHLFYIEKLTKRKVRRFTYFIISIGALIFLYSLNFFNIKSEITNSYIYERLVTTDLRNDSRINAWGEAFNGLFTYPLGGREATLSLNYAHNIWLDIGYDTGIIPTILFVILSFLVTVELIKFIRTDHPILLKSLVLCMSSAFLVIFLLEPVLQGLGVYFTIFCFLIGAVTKVNHLSKSKNIC